MPTKVKVQFKGLDQLKRDIREIPRRMKHLEGVKVQVEGELTTEKQAAIDENIADHILKGTPLKTKW